MGPDLLLIIMMVLFSAFFSGMEIAFVSANKMRMELDKKSDSISARILAIFSNHPGQYIATMLVGNNIALVVYGIAFARLLDPYLQNLHLHPSLMLLLQTIISTLIILFTAEFLPKTIFRINPNGALSFFALPLFLFYIIFFPITKITMGFSNLLLKTVFKGDDEEADKAVFSRVDLDHFVNEQDGMKEVSDDKLENEVKLFRNALEFSKVKLRETMVPRTEIVALEVGASLDELKALFIDSGYSRILFYEDNIDNIVGYVHHSMLFTHPESLRQRMKKILIVPESMPASRLLSKFIQQSQSIAVVVDEFGGTAGMVTIEDILEEIFGEIEDEHDTNDLTEECVSEDEYVFSARMELDYLVEKYRLVFPQEEAYETLAGYILYHHESIPLVGTEIEIKNYKFTILEATESRIELVRLLIAGDKQ
ncbi:MAG: hemolysin family protein [Mangrovibacterium sp.]